MTVLGVVGIVAGALAGVVVLYLAVVIFAPGFAVREQPLQRPEPETEDVLCSILLQICEQDNLVSKGSGLRTAVILGEYAQAERYPIDHFDIYFGEHFDRAVGDQIEFFERYLSPSLSLSRHNWRILP